MIGRGELFSKKKKFEGAGRQGKFNLYIFLRDWMWNKNENDMVFNLKLYILLSIQAAQVRT